MIEHVITGIISGIGYSIAGWQKEVSTNTDFKDIKLDLFRLGRSVLICGIVGAIAGATKQDFNVLIIGGLGIAVTKIINLAWKIIKGKLKL